MDSETFCREACKVLEINYTPRLEKVLHFLKLLQAHHWEHHRLGDAHLQAKRKHHQGGADQWRVLPEPEESPYRHADVAEAAKRYDRETFGDEETEREEKRPKRDRMRRGGRTRGSSNEESET